MTTHPYTKYSETTLRNSTISLQTDHEFQEGETIRAAISPVLNEKAEFEHLDTVAKRGIGALVDAGHALAEIKTRKLWKAGGYTSWKQYCDNVVKGSRSYIFRVLTAAEIASEMSKALPNGNILIPQSEAQIRPLRKLDPTQRSQAWTLAVEKAGKQPTAKQVSDVVFEILSNHQKSLEPSKVEGEIQEQHCLNNVVTVGGSGPGIEVECLTEGEDNTATVLQGKVETDDTTIFVEAVRKKVAALKMQVSIEQTDPLFAKLISADWDLAEDLYRLRDRRLSARSGPWKETGRESCG